MELTIEKTPIQRLTWKSCDNQIDIKRDDLIPFSFGGNKVRIGYEYWTDARNKGCDTMIAYGSRRSNMCRVIANLCRMSDMSCYIVAAVEEEEDELSGNSRILETLKTPVRICGKHQVSDTLNRLMEELRGRGKYPYYIYGDITGHGNELVGSQAYKKAFKEIAEQEKKQGYAYEYIFLASGTGTTQRGLLLGQAEYGGEQAIMGISIARDVQRGTAAIQDQLPAQLWSRIHFIDEYRGGGYGTRQEEVAVTIDQMMAWNGIALDATYTGKAYYGMLRWLMEHQIRGTKVLFLHTGGTPLYFDELFADT